MIQPNVMKRIEDKAKGGDYDRDFDRYEKIRNSGKRIRRKPNRFVDEMAKVHNQTIKNGGEKKKKKKKKTKEEKSLEDDSDESIQMRKSKFCKAPKTFGRMTLFEDEERLKSNAFLASSDDESCVDLACMNERATDYQLLDGAEVGDKIGHGQRQLVSRRKTEKTLGQSSARDEIKVHRKNRNVVTNTVSNDSSHHVTNTYNITVNNNGPTINAGFPFDSMTQFQQPMQAMQPFWQPMQSMLPFQQPMPSMLPFRQPNGQTLDGLSQSSLTRQERSKAILQDLHREHVHDTWIDSYLKACNIFQSQGSIRRGYKASDFSVAEWYERQRRDIRTMDSRKRELLGSIGIGID
jgi:hypothetical protein